MAPITSTDNPLVKRLSTLHDRHDRERDGLFLAEGRRAIDGFLAAGWSAAHLLVREGEPVPAHWPVAQTISPRVAAKLSSSSSPSGYLAAFPIPVAARLRPDAGGLVLAEVGDPGNVGTLIRSAAAFAIRQVVLIGGADPWSPKVVQSTAGALAAVELIRLSSDQGLAPLIGGASLTALVVSGGRPPEALAPRPRFLVVGGEARGIPAAWLADCPDQLTLPMPGGTESLNAAVAGSIAAYLLRRGEGAREREFLT